MFEIPMLKIQIPIFNSEVQLLDLLLIYDLEFKFWNFRKLEFTLFLPHQKFHYHIHQYLVGLFW